LALIIADNSTIIRILIELSDDKSGEESDVMEEEQVDDIVMKILTMNHMHRI